MVKGNHRLDEPDTLLRYARRAETRRARRMEALTRVKMRCPYCGILCPSRWVVPKGDMPLARCLSCQCLIKRGVRALYEFSARTESGQSVQTVKNISALARKLSISRQHLYKILKREARVGENLRTQLNSEKCHTIKVWPLIPIA